MLVEYCSNRHLYGWSPGIPLPPKESSPSKKLMKLTKISSFICNFMIILLKLLITKLSAKKIFFMISQIPHVMTTLAF